MSYQYRYTDVLGKRHTIYSWRLLPSDKTPAGKKDDKSLREKESEIQLKTLKKRRGHKKAIIAIARKMLVAIYHMIQDDADFLPVDHEETIQNNRNTKGPNLNNVIAFLKEQGADDNTIHLVKLQCSPLGDAAAVSGNKTAPKKQSVPGSAAASQPVQESVTGSPVLISGSQQGRALNHHPKDPAVAAAAT